PSRPRRTDRSGRNAYYSGVEVGLSWRSYAVDKLSVYGRYVAPLVLAGGYRARNAHPGIVLQAAGPWPTHQHTDGDRIGGAAGEGKAADHELALAQCRVVIDESDYIRLLAVKVVH